MLSNGFWIVSTCNTWKQSSTCVRKEYDCYLNEKQTTINHIIIGMLITSQYGYYMCSFFGCFYYSLYGFCISFCHFSACFCSKRIQLNIMHYNWMNNGMLPLHFLWLLGSRVEKLCLKRGGQHGCCCYVVIQWWWSTQMFEFMHVKVPVPLLPASRGRFNQGGINTKEVRRIREGRGRSSLVLVRPYVRFFW